MTGIQIYTQTLNELRSEFEDFKLQRKSTSRFMQLLSFLLTVITFGKSTDFMTSLVTTVGNTIYIPTDWDARDTLQRTCILRHERVHMRQRRRLGSFLFTLKYLMWPLPIIFAIGRRNLEREAYEESMRASLFFYGMSALENLEYRADMVGHFASPNYFWMWPFSKSNESWYDDVIEKLILEAMLRD